jgi:hypothetical protein
MSKYVLCLGEIGRRRALVHFLQRTGFEALACDGKSAIVAALRERGLPQLILSESPEHLLRAREAEPRLYEVGSLPFADFLRADGRVRKALLAG